MRSFGFSAAKLLSSSYPDHVFHDWLFEKMRVPDKFWHEESTRRRYYEWLTREMGISTLEDWYKVNIDDFHRLGGSRIRATCTQYFFLRRS
jgi:hypothetical protein